jgi:hypothetical protein
MAEVADRRPKLRCKNFNAFRNQSRDHWGNNEQEPCINAATWHVGTNIPGSLESDSRNAPETDSGVRADGTATGVGMYWGVYHSWSYGN